MTTEQAPTAEAPAAKPKRKSNAHRSRSVYQLGDLPPPVIEPLARRYCRGCCRWKYDRAFTNKGVKNLCDTCVRHRQELAEIRADDPQYDEKIAALERELNAEVDELNLPRVGQILGEFWAQEGGVKNAVAKIRYNLDHLDNEKPGSGVAMNVRMGMLKLQVAYEAVQLARAKQEALPTVTEAMDLIKNIMGEYSRIATGDAPPPLLAGLADGMSGRPNPFTVDARSNRASMEAFAETLESLAPSETAPCEATA